MTPNARSPCAIFVKPSSKSPSATVILPKDNVKDLRDIPKRVLKSLRLVPVAHVDEVLRVALALTDAADFLKEPSVATDWRIAPAERRDRERREDNSKMPVASAVPPPSATGEAPPSSAPPSDERT